MSKRKNKQSIIDPDEVIYRGAIEAFTLKQANEVFKNAEFSKYFPEVKRTYCGNVKKVEKDLPDANGNIDKGFQFLIE